MNLWEIFLIGVALSVDAFAAGMSDAACCPHMSNKKGAFIAVTFALFQFAMPLLGYFCGAAFSSLVARIAPFLSFALLFVIGGKAVLDWQTENASVFPAIKKTQSEIGVGKVLLQGVATSLDALAVGVTLLAQEMTVGLPVPMVLCSALIGATTLVCSSIAVRLGRAAGSRFERESRFWGGAVLVLIGCKILFEGVL